jgi:hypothetical protein
MKTTKQRQAQLNEILVKAHRALTCNHPAFQVQLCNTFTPHYRPRCTKCGEWLQTETAFESGVVNACIAQANIRTTIPSL